MATSGILIDEASRLLGLPRNAVALPWRVLREAGEVSKAGRGPSAAKVMVSDAAKLLIAVCSEAPLKSTLETFRLYGSMRSDVLAKSGDISLHSYPRLPCDHTLVEGISVLLSDLSDPESKGISGTSIRIEFEGPFPQAFIKMRNDRRVLEVFYAIDETSMSRDCPQQYAALLDADLRYTRSFGARTLFHLSRLIGAELEAISWEAVRNASH